MYRDNYQNIYVYSCIKILGGMTTPINRTIDNNRIHLQCKFMSNKNGKVVSVKGVNIE